MSHGQASTGEHLSATELHFNRYLTSEQETIGEVYAQGLLDPVSEGAPA